MIFLVFHSGLALIPFVIAMFFEWNQQWGRNSTVMMVEISKKWKNKQHPFNNEMKNSIIFTFCPSIHCLLLRIGPTSSMPSQESVWQASCSDVDPCQLVYTRRPPTPRQPTCPYPPPSPLHLHASLSDTCTWTSLLIPNLKGDNPPSSCTVPRPQTQRCWVWVRLAQSGCFCCKSYGDTVDAGILSPRLEAAGWLAHQDEWHVLGLWDML